MTGEVEIAPDVDRREDGRKDPKMSPREAPATDVALVGVPAEATAVKRKTVTAPAFAEASNPPFTYLGVHRNKAAEPESIGAGVPQPACLGDSPTVDTLLLSGLRGKNDMVVKHPAQVELTTMLASRRGTFLHWWECPLTPHREEEANQTRLNSIDYRMFYSEDVLLDLALAETPKKEPLVWVLLGMPHRQNLT
ncbi:hypothetical protein FKM82_021791 [Ascaphus truei]